MYPIELTPAQKLQIIKLDFELLSTKLAAHPEDGIVHTALSRLKDQAFLSVIFSSNLASVHDTIIEK
jgi:hypothetical protein